MAALPHLVPQSLSRRGTTSRPCHHSVRCGAITSSMFLQASWNGICHGLRCHTAQCTDHSARSRRRRISRSDLEIVVLQHEVNVLRHQIKRTHLRPSDRAFLDRIGSRTATGMLGAFPRDTEDAVALAPRARAPEMGSILVSVARARPPLPTEVRELILRMASEKSRRATGASRASSSIKVSAKAIRKLLARSGLGPAPRRGGSTWRRFPPSRLRAHQRS
jgi:hypothetical protein